MSDKTEAQEYFNIGDLVQYRYEKYRVTKIGKRLITIRPIDDRRLKSYKSVAAKNIIKWEKAYSR